MAMPRVGLWESVVTKPSGCLGAIAAAILVAGCGRSGTVVRTRPLPAAADPWRLVCNDPSATEPALLWNGRIGIRLARDGSGVGADGRGLPFFHIDKYEAAGEEKIIPQPNPLMMRPTLNGKPVTAGMEDYSQVLDMRTGELVSRWTAPSSGGARIRVEHDVVLDPSQPIIAERWQAGGASSGAHELLFAGAPRTLGGGGTVRAGVDGTVQGAAIHSAGRSSTPERGEASSNKGPGEPSPFPLPEGEGFGSGSKGAAVSSPRAERDSLGGQAFNKVVVGKGNDQTFIYDFRGPENARSAGEPASYEQVLTASVQEWSRRWKTDIQIDGPVEDQQAVRSFLFYLRSAIDPDAGMSLSPFGLSNAMYNGHVFWDADIWVLPALALIDPREAAAIPRYRLNRADHASLNFRDWLAAGRPTAFGKIGGSMRFGVASQLGFEPEFHPTLPSPPAERDSLRGRGLRTLAPLAGDSRTGESTRAGIMFPWESSVSGRETVPGPSRFEHHITGSVAFSIEQAAALGLVSEADAQRVVAGADQFYLARSQVESEPVLSRPPGRTGPDQRVILNVMSPDESHVGDNDLYTNLLAEWAHRGGEWGGGTGVKIGRSKQFGAASQHGFEPESHPTLSSPRAERDSLGVGGKSTLSRVGQGGGRRSEPPVGLEKSLYKLPSDSGGFLTYDGDPLRSYKQAAAILSIYPLQYPPAEDRARSMMDRFASKVTKNGPAMSDSLDAIILCRLGDAEAAYRAWKSSWRPFMTSPLGLFSEKQVKTNTYFTTGAGGSLQAVLYGFLGFRLDSKPAPKSIWSEALPGHRYLSVSPNLPTAWKSVKFTNFSVLGRHYTLTVSQGKMGTIR